MSTSHLDIGSGNGIFASSLAGFVDESWAQDYVIPEILNPNVYFSFADSKDVNMILEKSKIKKVEGYMYEYNIPPGLISEDKRNYSELILSENSRTLNSPMSLHQGIKELGLGRYSHWGNLLYFSSSDNSDPRTNGMVYRLNTNRAQYKYFDSISIFHTLEHVKNPVEFMNTIKNYVKYNGRIFISVPNTNSHYRDLFDSKQEKFDTLNYPPHHLTWWRPEDLVELAIRCGLKPIRLYFEIIGASGLNSSIQSNISMKSRRNLFYENEIQGRAYLNDVLYANFLDCQKANYDTILNQGFTMLIEIRNLQ
jgi:SAM-dependent methyltransferase